MNLTFSKYLKEQAHRDDAVGDFARDYRMDHNNKKPSRFKRFKTIEKYLLSIGACDNAVRASKTAFEEWKKTVDKQETM